MRIIEKHNKTSYETLNQKEANELANTYIKQEKHDDLKILLSARKHNLNILDWAIDYLNPDLIDLILKNTEKGDRYLNITISNVISKINKIDQISLIRTKNNSFSKTGLFEVKGKMIKSLLNFKLANIKKLNTENEGLNLELDQLDIKILSNYCSYEDLKKFIKDNEIDVSKFEDHLISSLLLQNPQVLLEEVQDNKSPLQVLLSRTYVVNGEKKIVVNEAFKKLLSWPETNKIFHYVAAKITNGDDLKILFTDNSSYYDIDTNFITVQTEVSSLNSIESIAAQEFSHYLMNKIFDNSCQPFSFYGVTKVFYNTEINTSNYNSNINTENLLNEFPQEHEKLIKQLLDYNKAAIELLKLAASMLGYGVEKFNHTDDLVKYLKDNTILPIFLLHKYENSVDCLEKSVQASIQLNLKPAYLKLTNSILSYNRDCGSEYINENYSDISNKFIPEDIENVIINENHLDISNKSIQGYIDAIIFISDKLYPAIIDEKKIQPDQNFFLSRIADILFRKTWEDKLAQFVVRLPEFAVMRQAGELKDPKIIKSFKPMTEFWDVYITPQMDSTIEASGLTTETNLIEGE